MASILGLIIAIITALNRHLTLDSKWRHYRLNAELIRDEGEDFFALANFYKNCKDITKPSASSLEL